uniref:Uncharacterized protein n=1 Tax=Scleropages formosus TaxID=113540 RepID=A0A8C9RV04_SCLFO
WPGAAGSAEPGEYAKDSRGTKRHCLDASSGKTHPCCSPCSPVSKDELTSNLPDNELQKSSTSNACALEDLLDITSQVSCPALSAGEPLGDCNKNLIEDFYPSAEAQLIQSFISSPDERNLQ